MQVAYVITRSDNVGGAHIHVRDLASSLRALGHEPTVVVGGEGPFTEELRQRGVVYRSVRYLTREIRPVIDVAAIHELRRCFQSLRPDIVSTHSSKAGWLGRLAARSLHIPVIFTAHGWAFTDGVPELKRRIYGAAERLVGPLANRIITVSEHDRHLALEYGIAPPEKLVTIHNGMPDVGPELRGRPGLHPPRIVMVARFEPQKDHSTLLMALARLRHLPWELELIGGGPLLEKTRVLAEKLGLSMRVAFLGARRDVPARLARAQLFVLSTNWEGLPRSILEAMRAGLPIVASNVGGVAETVIDEETGFLVPRSDVDLLTDRLSLLLTSPDLRTRMGIAGRRRYEQSFTFGRMLTRTLAVYENAIARGA